MTAIMQFGDYISSKTVQELTPDQYQKFTWSGYGCSNERQKLKAGIIHLTKENAQIHLDALLSFTRNN